MADYSKLLRDNPDLLAAVTGRMQQENPFTAPAPQPAAVPQQEMGPAIEGPVSPGVAPIEQTRNARQSGAQVRDTLNERIAGAEAVGQSHLREGEARAQGAQALAAESGASADRANAFHQEAVDAVRNNRALQEQYRKQAEADLAKASEEPHGMAKFAPMIMGIVGAAAQMGGNQGVAQGMGALGQIIGQQSREKAARAATQFDGHQSLAKLAMHDSQNELDAATKLMAQEHEVTARQLERIGQESSIPAYREQAMRLAAASRDQGLALRQQYYSTMEAQQLAAGRAAGKKELTLAELMAKDQAGTITPSEKNALLGIQGKATEIDSKTAENARQEEELRLKREQDAKGGKLTANEEKMLPVVEGAKEAYGRLSKLASGSPDKVDMPTFGVRGVTSYLPDAYIPESHLQHKADVESMFAAVMRGESGGKVDETEIKGKRAAYGMDSSDETVRARGLQALLKQFKKLDTRGILDQKPTELKTLRPKAK